MPSKKIFLKSPKELPRAVKKLERVVYREILKALRKTARYGESQVVRMARSTQPRPLAHGSYMNSWVVKDTDRGAILGNTAYHSYFVEVGRLPGKKPPLAPILDWVRVKRISQRAMKSALGIKKVSLKPDQVNKKAFSWMKNPKARSKARRRRTNRFKKENLTKSFAFYVQRIIGERGYRGRFVLKRTMPKISKRLRRELRGALKTAISKYGL